MLTPLGRQWCIPPAHQSVGVRRHTLASQRSPPPLPPDPCDLFRTTSDRIGERRCPKKPWVMGRLLRQHFNVDAPRAIHATSIRFVSANHHAQQRCLPRSVRSHESNPLASGHTHTDVLKNGDRANLTSNVAQRENAHRAPPDRTARRRAAARSVAVAPRLPSSSDSLHRGPRRNVEDFFRSPAEPAARRPRGSGWQRGQ